MDTQTSGREEAVCLSLLDCLCLCVLGPGVVFLRELEGNAVLSRMLIRMQLSSPVSLGSQAVFRMPASCTDLRRNQEGGARTHRRPTVAAASGGGPVVLRDGGEPMRYSEVVGDYGGGPAVLLEKERLCWGQDARKAVQGLVRTRRPRASPRSCPSPVESNTRCRCVLPAPRVSFAADSCSLSPPSVHRSSVTCSAK